MLYFLLWIFLIGIVFVFVFLAIVLNFFRSIFGGGKRRNYTNNNADDGHFTSTTKSNKKAKIIDKSEGEYVDFEEIKD